MNLNALPGKITNGLNVASNNVSLIDKFFNSQPTFTQASKLNSWQPGEVASNQRYGLPDKDSFRISVAEDRARTLPLTDPITVGFKMLIDWDKDYGLICDEDITPEQAMTTKNNSAVAYLYRIGETNRAKVLQRWIKNFKELVVLYDFLFLHVEGLDIVQNKKPGHIFTEDDKLNIVFRETVDLRVQAMINTYNWIWYDNIRGVEVLPSNLRKFDAFIMVFDVNYYSTLLYDLDQKALSGISPDDKKYQLGTYQEHKDMIKDFDNDKITAEELDKRETALQSRLTDMYNEDMAKFNQLVGKIKGSANERNVLPTKQKVGSLVLYDVDATGISNVKNNVNQHVGFNHMIYEFKSMQIDSTESAKGFTGNVSNEPNSEFVRNNITFNYKRAFATGDFYNTFAFPTSDGDYNANPADLIAMASIQKSLEREYEIVSSVGDVNENGEIGLGTAVVVGTKKSSTVLQKGKFDISVDWKKTNKLLQNVAIQAGKELGREIWIRQKNKILSQNSVIGNLLNVFENQGVGRIMVDLIKDNLGYKLQGVVNNAVNKITDVLPTKDDQILRKVGSDNNGSLSNGAQLLVNPVSVDPQTGVPFNIPPMEPLHNEIRTTNENIYSGNVHPNNPEYKTGMNVYDGTGF